MSWFRKKPKRYPPYQPKPTPSPDTPVDPDPKQ